MNEQHEHEQKFDNSMVRRVMLILSVMQSLPKHMSGKTERIPILTPEQVIIQHDSYLPVKFILNGSQESFELYSTLFKPVLHDIQTTLQV